MPSSKLVLIVAVVVAGVASAEAMSDNGACEEFVKASLAFQRTLADKVKALNGRPVYLFDASGFAAGLQDAVTTDFVRYKTGTVDGVAVDAVLSQSAQRSLAGVAGAQTYRQWAAQGDLHVDIHGVRF